MALAVAETLPPVQEPGGFDVLQAAYENPRFLPTLADLDLYGQYEVAYAAILEQPSDAGPGNIVTNSSEIMYLDRTGRHDDGERLVIGGRHEPQRFHLGKSNIRSYLLEGVHAAMAAVAEGRGRIPLPRLNPYIDIPERPGEDMRTVYGIRQRLPISGRIVTGWLTSSVVATPVPGHPTEVDHVTHEHRWGESLDHTEIVAEVTDPDGIIEKNTICAPAYVDWRDLSLHSILRPKPHMAYARLRNVNDINNILNVRHTLLTEEYMRAVDPYYDNPYAGQANLIHDYLQRVNLPGSILDSASSDLTESDRKAVSTDPKLVHLGPNRITVLPRGPRGELRFHINGHEAVRDIVSDEEAFEGNKTILHYRTADFGAKLSPDGRRLGRFLLLGDHIERGDLPLDAPSKPSENGVFSYYDVNYGSLGRTALRIGGLSPTVIGVSDTALAFLVIRRIDPRKRRPRQRNRVTRAQIMERARAFALAA